MPFDPNGNFTIPNNIVSQYLAGQKNADPAPLDANYNDIALGLAQLWDKTGQATETVTGTVSLATSSEAAAGTNDTKAMTPLKTKAVWKILNTYSTTEQDTGGKWIDGKAIYRKVINTGALPNNTVKCVAHGITDLSVVLTFAGAAYRPSPDNAFFPLPFVSGSPVYIASDATSIYITTLTDRTNVTSSWVILAYTKNS